MLTIEDLRNPRRKSGFNHVRSAGGVGRGHGGGKPWTATLVADASGGKERGPRRATAEEAAQDYCDYINSRATPAPQPTLKTANHPQREKVEIDEEERAALGVIRDKRAQRTSTKQGAVYLIGETDEWYAVKVGYSLKPEARAGELQTGNPRELRLLASRPGTIEDERRLHSKYARWNILGEWFEATDELLGEFGIAKGTSTK